MIKKKVFIDGRTDTTALLIEKRLSVRDDIELISMSDDLRKDLDARKEFLNAADIVFLCLPESAAKGAIAMIDNLDTVVIDTSAAYRTNPSWAYGFPELSPEFEEKIKKSRRISLPGCQSSGFIALIYPLIKAGLLRPDAALTAHAVAGYSDGGKNMISEYRAKDRSPLLSAPRQYELLQSYKHTPEILYMTGLSVEPIVSPYVCDFYSGTEITIPLFKSQLLRGGINHIKAVYRAIYNYPTVYFNENADENGFISAAALSGKDAMQIEVHGNDDRILLVARYDNLGKGSSGAAIECLNLKLGCDITKGLQI